MQLAFALLQKKTGCRLASPCGPQYGLLREGQRRRGINVTNMAETRFDAVVVAAGRGERAGQQGGPKQYRMIGGKPVLRHALESYLRHPKIRRVIAVIHADDRALFEAASAGLDAGRLAFVTGASDRQGSVLKGLDALSGEPPDFVLIHDGVRPFCDAAIIDRAMEALGPDNGVLAAVPVSDTLKKGDPSALVAGTLPRDGLFAAQTPQGFPFSAILEAHRKAETSGLRHFTDDAAIAEWAGLPVRLIAGSPDNFKITWPRDIAMADRILAAAFPDVRTGNGYDVHTFGPGDHVWLCGVKIPHEKTLSGHSDADVGLHALTDALLATIGAGDIGTHFPPSDPQWKGAPSHIFVEHAVRLVKEKGGRIANADITLIAEAPKVGPHRVAMTAALCAMLGVGPERVSVKATTNEKMGFVGRREGIAAIATATVIYPGEVPE